MATNYREFPTGFDYYNAHPELHPLTRTKLWNADSGLAQKLKQEGKWEMIPKSKMGPRNRQTYQKLWRNQSEHTTAFDYFMEHPELHSLSPSDLLRFHNPLSKNLKRNGFFEQLFPNGYTPGVPTKSGNYMPGIDTILHHESRQEGRIFGYADLHMAAYYVMKQILEHGQLGRIPEEEKKSSGDEVNQRELVTPDLKRIVRGFGEFRVDGDNQRTLFIGGLRLDYRHDQYLVDSLVIRGNKSDDPPLDGVYRVDINGSNRVRLLKLFKDGSRIVNANFELSSPRRTIRAAPYVKVDMKEIGNGQHLLSIVQGQIPDDVVDLVKRIDSSLMGTHIALGGVPLTERQFMNWMFAGGE